MYHEHYTIFILVMLSVWAATDNKTTWDRSDTPSYHPLFCLRASINFTTICLSIGRKVRAAPTSTKEASNYSGNTATFHFEQIFKRKLYIYISGVLWTCETDNLRISSVSHLLSHSSLTTPHGTYINLWFMRSKFPLYLSVITVWLHFSLLGSDIQFNQKTLN